MFTNDSSSRQGRRGWAVACAVAAIALTGAIPAGAAGQTPRALAKRWISAFSGASDPKAEAAILAAIERQAAARTVILITHRVAAARRCDGIIVLDGGHVVEHPVGGDRLKIHPQRAGLPARRR